MFKFKIKYTRKSFFIEYLSDEKNRVEYPLFLQMLHNKLVLLKDDILERENIDISEKGFDNKHFSYFKEKLIAKLFIKIMSQNENGSVPLMWDKKSFYMVFEMSESSFESLISDIILIDENKEFYPDIKFKNEYKDSLGKYIFMDFTDAYLKDSSLVECICLKVDTGLTNFVYGATFKDLFRKVVLNKMAPSSKKILSYEKTPAEKEVSKKHYIFQLSLDVNSGFSLMGSKDISSMVEQIFQLVNKMIPGRDEDTLYMAKDIVYGKLLIELMQNKDYLVKNKKLFKNLNVTEGVGVVSITGEVSRVDFEDFLINLEQNYFIQKTYKEYVEGFNELSVGDIVKLKGSPESDFMILQLESVGFMAKLLDVTGKIGEKSLVGGMFGIDCLMPKIFKLNINVEKDSISTTYN